MGDENEDNGWENESLRRRRSLNKKRLMRLSTRLYETVKEPTKLDQWYKGDIGQWVQNLQRDDRKSMTVDKTPPSCYGKFDKSVADDYGEETDKILETLHNLKRWLKRMWRWGQCYTQYCYPTLRTVEYYRKAREHQKRKRKCLDRRAKRNSKKPDNLESVGAAGASAPLVIPDDRTKDLEDCYSDKATVQTEPSHCDPCPNNQPQEVKNKIEDSDKMIVPVKLAMNEARDDSFLSWTEYISKQFNAITRAMAFFSSNNEDSIQITMFFKWMCYLFLPAVFIMGVHYAFLKKKYKSLSGKLKRIKDENNILVKESSKLESLLISTEQLTMTMSTKESRAQAVADFTRLSESLMNSKKEINQMKTERAALLEELKMARRRRNEAHNKYTSLTHGVRHDNRIET